MDSDSPLPLLILGVSLLAFLVVSAIWAALGLSGKYAGPPWPEAQAPTRATQRIISRYDRTALLISTLRIAFLLSAAISLASWLIPQEWANWLYILLMAIGLLVTLGVAQGIAISLGRRKARRVLLATAPVLTWADVLFSPILWMAERLGIAVLRWRIQDDRGTSGDNGDSIDGEEVYQVPVEEVREANPEERRMIHAILELEDVAAREVMVPRVDIVAVEDGTPLAEVAARMAQEGHSRLPVYEDSVDNIIGIVHARDILQSMTADGGSLVALADIVRPALFIPDSKPIDQLLKELREQGVSIAVVVDEYGGVEGILTIEDLLEEIVGEIEDEFQKEGPAIVRVSETEAIVDGHVNLEDVNDLFKMSLRGDGFDTVGGLLSSYLGRIPAPGDLVTVDGLTLRVLSTHGRRVRKVRIAQNGEASA